MDSLETGGHATVQRLGLPMLAGFEILMAMSGERHFKTACTRCALLLVLMALASGCHKPSTRLEPQIQFCEEVELGCLPEPQPPWTNYTDACRYYDDKATRLLEPLRPKKDGVITREYTAFWAVAFDVSNERAALIFIPEGCGEVRTRAMEKAKIAADILRQIQAKE